MTPRERLVHAERMVLRWRRRVAVALTDEERRKAESHLAAWEAEVKQLEGAV